MLFGRTAHFWRLSLSLSDTHTPVHAHRAMSKAAESVRMKLAVQADWDNKQFSNALSLHVKRLFEFVLQFESTTRSKIAKLNEKLTLLERQLEFLEAQASSANAPDRDD